MSLSKPINQLNPNPSKRYWQIKAGQEQGNVSHYIKPEKQGEKGKDIIADWSEKGFFLLDDNLLAITGWNDDEKFKIQSNEVRQLTEDGEQANAILTVKKYKDGKVTVMATGTYAELKENPSVVSATNGSYTNCLYIVTVGEDGKLQQDHLQLSGSSYAAWLEFKKANKNILTERWINIVDWELKQRGQTKYKVPVFAVGPKVEKEEYNLAVELDAIVQEYLEGYMRRGNKKTESSQQNQEDTPPPTGFNIKNWRRFEEPGKPPLGSLSIKEIIKLQGDLEDKGDVDTVVYDCVSQAKHDYEQLKKSGEWKNETNAEGVPLGEMTLKDLQAALTRILSAKPNHVKKLAVEVGIEVLEAEAAKAKPVDVEVVSKSEKTSKDSDYDDDDDIPF